MGSHDVGFELHIQGEEPMMHLLKTRQIGGESAVPVTEQALDITLTMEFRVASAVTMRQANPVQGITVAEESVVFRREEAGDPTPGSGLHSFHSLVEGLFDGSIQDSSVFQGHIQ